MQVMLHVRVFAQFIHTHTCQPLAVQDRDKVEIHPNDRGGGFVSMRNCLSPSSSFRHSADTSKPYFTVDLAYTRSPLSPAFPSDRCRPAAREQPLRVPLGPSERLCGVADGIAVQLLAIAGQSSAGGRDVGISGLSRPDRDGWQVHALSLLAKG